MCPPMARSLRISSWVWQSCPSIEIYMTGSRRHFSVQTKVLIPVLTFLILLPTITLWIVNEHISNQVTKNARQALSTAEAVFLKSSELRVQDFLLLYRNAVQQPSFKAVALLNDPITMQDSMARLLAEFGEQHELAMFIASDGHLLASTPKRLSGDIPEFEKVTVPISERALSGQPDYAPLSFRGKAYYILSVPIRPTEKEDVVGALTVGLRINDGTLKELKDFTRTEILFTTNNTVVTSTFQRQELAAEVLRQIASRNESDLAIDPVVLEGEHFMALAAAYQPGDLSSGLRYILLS